MSKILANILLLGVLIFYTFQWILIHNYSATEDTLELAMNESLKEAAIKGRFTAAEYDYFEDVLIENNIDPNKVQVTGTESIKVRGEYISLKVVAKMPPRTVMETFRIFNDDELFNKEKIIMSELIVR